MPLSKIQFGNTGRRNLVINGGMKVAQRGTVTGITTGDYAGPDRILWTNGSLGTWTISQSTDVPAGEGFSNSWKVDCTSATASPGGGAYAAPSYNFEGRDLQGLCKGTSSAKKITVSFFVKSNKTGTYIGELRDHDNNRHISKTWTISSANTWEKKILTFDGDTTGALDNDNNNSFTFYWYLGAGTNFTSGTLATSWASLVAANRAAGLNVNLGDNTANEWLVTGLQIEIGDTATDFEHRSFAEELALCRRYFYRWNTDGEQYSNLCIGGVLNSSQARGVPQLPQTMRSNASIAQSGDFRIVSMGSGAVRTSITISINRGHTLQPYVQFAGSGGSSLTAGQTAEMGANASAAAYVDFDAEL